MLASVNTPANNRQCGLIISEIIVMVAVVLILGGMTLGLAVRVSQRASLTVCLNNLRQLGIADATYAGDQRGYLPLPRSNADHDLNRLWPDQLGIAQDRAESFMCPQFTRTGSQDTTRAMWAEGTVGYTLYRLAASGTGTSVTSPNGRILWDTQLREGFGTSAGGAHIARENHLEAGAVRMGESYADCRPGRDGRTEAGATNTGWYHTTRWSPRPEGGNILLGDLSGRYSRNMIASLSGTLTFIAP